MVFTCERCLVEFARKMHLKSHLQKQKVCATTASTRDRSEILKDLTTRELADKTYDCEFCGMQFNHRSVKCRHRQTCKQNPANIETVTISKEEYQTLKGHGMTINNTTNNNTTNNNTTNNITQNITINVNNFGQEDISHLQKCYEFYWTHKAFGLIEMAQDVHFDPAHPENHTLTITNQRAKIAKVRENGKWVPKSFDKVLDEIVAKVQYEIYRFFEEKGGYLEDKFPGDVNKWWNEVGTSDFNEKEYRNMMSDFIEMVIMHRHIIDKVS